MNHLLVPLGLILVFVGIAIIIIGSIIGGQSKNTGFAVGGFIGPFVFGFANNREMFYLVIAISVIMLILFLVYSLRCLQ